MRTDTSSKPVPGKQMGQLSLSEGCPSLMRGDGRRFWLEMDFIPQDLIDQQVAVEGMVHQQNLIVVERIGRPAPAA
jgi:hypothetical protein